MPSNNGHTGLGKVHHGEDAEWRAFDSLPSAVKDCIRTSGVKFSCVETLKFMKKNGTAATITQLEKMSWKAYYNNYPEIARHLLGI